MASAIFRAIKEYKEELEFPSSNLVKATHTATTEIDSTKLMPKNNQHKKVLYLKSKLKRQCNSKNFQQFRITR